MEKDGKKKTSRVTQQIPSMELLTGEQGKVGQEASEEECAQVSLGKGLPLPG